MTLYSIFILRSVVPLNSILLRALHEYPAVRVGLRFGAREEEHQFLAREPLQLLARERPIQSLQDVGRLKEVFGGLLQCLRCDNYNAIIIMTIIILLFRFCYM